MDTLEQYIEEHKVTKANALIFRDGEKFLKILFENNWRVEMIIWYEYCRINEQRIGMGGYIDPVSKGFMWAETQLFDTELREKSFDEILEYISNMRARYPEFDLYPEFYIAE